MAILSKKNNRGIMPLFDKIGALENKKSIIKFFAVILLLFIFYNIPKAYLGETYPICLFRIIFGLKCIGCGTTRAFWSIMHFNFHDAIEYNKLVVVTFPLLTGCIIHWIIKK